MARNPATRKTKRVLDPDRDRLGLLVGLVCAGIVVFLCFFVQKTGLLDTAFRGGLAFLGGYVATMILVTIILSISNKEKQEAKALAKKRAAERAEESTEEEGEG